MFLSTISKSPGENEFTLLYSDGSFLSWDPKDPTVLFDHKEGRAVCDGPRYEAWVEYRECLPAEGDRCCIYRRSEAGCIIHGNY